MYLFEIVDLLFINKGREISGKHYIVEISKTKDYYTVVTFDVGSMNNYALRVPIATSKKLVFKSL